MRHLLRQSAACTSVVMVFALTASIARADGPVWKTISQDFEGQLFGLNVGHDEALLVADSGAGPLRLDPDDGDTSLLASPPGGQLAQSGVTDVLQVGHREYLAVTGGGEPGSGAMSLYRIKNGNVTQIADLHAFEAANDPAQDGVESNPFDLAQLSHNQTLVADAAGNSLLVVDKDGHVDWVATFPQHDIPTQPVKDAVGCPAGPPDICELPDIFAADPVPTTVASGPDGALYVGELTGFPATPGQSRVWRLERSALHVRCGVDPECMRVETGPFTSIIDIKFGKDGTAYVVEIDENSWRAVQAGQGVGGTVNTCRAANGNSRAAEDDEGDHGNVLWSCEAIATGLPFPLAVAIEDEAVYVTLTHSAEGPFEVAQLRRIWQSVPDTSHRLAP